MWTSWSICHYHALPVVNCKFKRVKWLNFLTFSILCNTDQSWKRRGKVWLSRQHRTKKHWKRLRIRYYTHYLLQRVTFWRMRELFRSWTPLKYCPMKSARNKRSDIFTILGFVLLGKQHLHWQRCWHLGVKIFAMNSWFVHIASKVMCNRFIARKLLPWKQYIVMRPLWDKLLATIFEDFHMQCVSLQNCIVASFPHQSCYRLRRRQRRR